MVVRNIVCWNLIFVFNKSCSQEWFVNESAFWCFLFVFWRCEWFVLLLSRQRMMIGAPLTGAKCVCYILNNFIWRLILENMFVELSSSWNKSNSDGNCMASSSDNFTPFRGQLSAQSIWICGVSITDCILFSLGKYRAACLAKSIGIYARG